MYHIELVYYIFPLLCLLFSFFNKRTTQLQIVVLTGVFLLLYTFSLNGADIYAYKGLYESSVSYRAIKTIHGEIGFKLVMLLCNKMGMTYLTFRVLLLAITTLIFGYSVSRLTDNYALAMFFLSSLFVIYTISTYRQYIVMSGFLYWLYRYGRKPSVAPFVGIGLLTFFHKSALLLLALLCVYHFVFKRDKMHTSFKLCKWIWVYMALAFVVRVVFVFLMKVPEIARFMSRITNEYSDNDVSLLSLGLLSRLVFLVGITYLFKIKRPTDGLVRMLYVMYVLGSIIYIMVPFETFMGRLINNTHMLCIVLVPMLFRYSGKSYVVAPNVVLKENKSVLKGVVLLLVLTSIVILTNQLMRQSGYTPYVNILFGDKLQSV